MIYRQPRLIGPCTLSPADPPCLCQCIKLAEFHITCLSCNAGKTDARDTSNEITRLEPLVSNRLVDSATAALFSRQQTVWLVWKGLGSGHFQCQLPQPMILSSIASPQQCVCNTGFPTITTYRHLMNCHAGIFAFNRLSLCIGFECFEVILLNTTFHSLHIWLGVGKRFHMFLLFETETASRRSCAVHVGPSYTVGGYYAVLSRVTYVFLFRLIK